MTKIMFLLWVFWNVETFLHANRVSLSLLLLANLVNSIDYKMPKWQKQAKNNKLTLDPLKCWDIFALQIECLWTLAVFEPPFRWQIATQKCPKQPKKEPKWKKRPKMMKLTLDPLKCWDIFALRIECLWTLAVFEPPFAGTLRTHWSFLPCILRCNYLCLVRQLGTFHDIYSLPLYTSKHDLEVFSSEIFLKLVFDLKGI